MQFETDTTAITNHIDSALKAYEATRDDFRSKASGAEFQTSDGRKMRYEDPLYTVEWRTDELAKATAAYEQALEAQAWIERNDEDVDVLAAVKQYVAHYEERRRYDGGGSSNPFANAIKQYKREGADGFVERLSDYVRYAESRQNEMAEKVAAQAAALIEAVDENQIAVLLADARTYLTYDEDVLDALLSKFGLSVRLVVGLVENADEQSKRKRQDEAKAAKEQRDAREAVRCDEQVYGSSYRGHRCEKAGRYVITLEGGKTTRRCGTHAKTWRTDGKILKAGDTFNGQKIVSVIDTKAKTPGA